MSKTTRRKYDLKFKMRVALEVYKGEKALSQVASENGIAHYSLDWLLRVGGSRRRSGYRFSQPHAGPPTGRRQMALCPLAHPAAGALRPAVPRDLSRHRQPAAPYLAACLVHTLTSQRAMMSSRSSMLRCLWCPCRSPPMNVVAGDIVGPHGPLPRVLPLR